MPLRLCTHPQQPRSIRRGGHGFDRIVDQVEDDLSQLSMVAVDRRQVGRKFGFGRNTVILQLSVQRLQHVKCNLVDIDRQSPLIAPLKQGADAVEQLARVKAVGDDSVQNCPQLVKIGGRHLKKAHCSSAAARNGRQGLAYFVGDRSRGRLDVQQFVVSFALQRLNRLTQGEFGPSKVRDVRRDAANSLDFAAV